MHLVLLDNGRTKLLADREKRFVPLDAASPARASSRCAIATSSCFSASRLRCSRITAPSSTEERIGVSEPAE